jgi:hypothetical protein
MSNIEPSDLRRIAEDQDKDRNKDVRSFHSTVFFVRAMLAAVLTAGPGALALDVEPAAEGIQPVQVVRHGFRLTDETYTLPPMRISRKEAFSFGLARKLLAHDECTPYTSTFGRFWTRSPSRWRTT